MKTFVLISAIIELVAGAFFLLAPQLMPGLQEATESNFGFIRMYGAAAVALGVFAFQVWGSMGNRAMETAFLTTFIVFNTCVAIGLYTCYTGGALKDLAGVGLHASLALITLFFYFKNN